MMPGSSTVWSSGNATKTLKKLGKDYPGYTSSELYAIWCVQNDAVPMDGQKVDVSRWKLQAGADGKFVEGGFSPSPVLWGRAKKAKRGQPKPGRISKAKGAPRDGSAGAAESRLSATAVRFAQRYDKAGQAIELVQQKKLEIQELLTVLKDTSKAIAEDLAQNDADARKILKEAGAL